MLKFSKNSLRQATTIFPVSLIILSFGATFGWVEPAMNYLKSPQNNHFVASESQLSWIASAYFAGEIITSILTGTFQDKMGRKSVLLLGAFLLGLSWFILIWATSFYAIFAGRAIMGVSAGVYDVTWSAYIGEVTTPTERGVLGSLMISVNMAGILLEFLLSMYAPLVYLAVVPFLISAIAFALTLFIVETPQYLIMQGREDAAIANLAWLRGQNKLKTVQKEFDIIKENVKEEMENREGILRFVWSPSEYKVVFVGILIFLFVQSSGNIIIISYETMMLESFVGIPDAQTITLIYGLVQFVFVNVSPFLIETVPRRVQLITGFTVATLIHIANACLLYMVEGMDDGTPSIPQTIFVLFNVYGAIYSGLLMPTVWVLKSEIFPQKSKAFGNCSSTALNALTEFVVVKLCMRWVSSTVYVNFVICAIVSGIAILYVYVLVPETKGQTLVQIQHNIKDRNDDQTDNKLNELQN